MSTVVPFDLDNQKGVNLSSCVLAKPNQLLSIYHLFVKEIAISDQTRRSI
jgi:hypothetical protein